MQTQSEIRVGIVGLGFGRQVHAPAFQSVSGCRVVALASTCADRAQAAAAAMPDARGYGAWREMLEAGGLDAISIAVPPAMQPEIAIAAADRGLGVFCEKPAAGMVSQADDMLAAVRRNGVPHAVNFLFPEIPAWQAAKGVIADMAVSYPLRNAALTWRVETYAQRHDLHDGWKRSPGSGGGALNTFVSHSAYYLEWLFGPMRAVIARLLPSPADDAQVVAWIEFESGFRATLDVATNCPFGSGHRLEVYGRDGAVVLENIGADYVRGFNVRACSRSGSIPFSLEPIPGAEDGRIWATARIATRFIERMRYGGSGSPDLADGLRVQRILEAFRESDRTGGWVEVGRGEG
jgi:predicted dehydrogenase